MLEKYAMLRSMKEGQVGGSILLMVLVLTGMVVVFLVSGVLLSGRQFNATVEQEEEERAFHAAEAGVHYALYLLNNELSGEDEFTLAAAGVWPEQQVFQEDTGELLGTHALTFRQFPSEDPGRGLMVYSLGEDARSKQCQVIFAEIRRVSQFKAVYGVTSWDHLADCVIPPAPTPT